MAASSSGPLQVAVLGTGPIGLGCAAIMYSRGHEPILWTPRGKLTTGITELVSEGKLDQTIRVQVTSNMADAVAGASVVLVTVPAYAYRTTLESLGQCLRSGQQVIMSGHLSLGALFLSRQLAQRGVIAPILAWSTTLLSGARLTPTKVLIRNIRAEIDCAAIPKSAGEALRRVSCSLFGDRYRLRDGLAAIALSNVNPQNHLAIALCNMTRIEKGEEWRQHVHTTHAVGRMIEAMDAERLAVAAAFGVEVRDVRRHFHLSFHVPEGPVGDQTAALAGTSVDPNGPTTLDTRYVLEDTPFGLYPMEVLGRISGMAMPLYTGGRSLMSAFYGRDFAAENDLMPPLKLEQLDLASVKKLLDEGWPLIAAKNKAGGPEVVESHL